MKKLIYVVLCLSAILTACSPGIEQLPAVPPDSSSPVSPESPAAPAQDPNAIQFFDCGILDLSNTDSIAGRENFEEFLNVTGTGKSASIQLTKKDGSLTLSFDGSAYTLKDADAETTWKQIQVTESSASGKIYQTFRLTNEENLSTEIPDGEQSVTLFKEAIES